MNKTFEINRTKIKGGCQSGRKVVTNNSKSDFLLAYLAPNSKYGQVALHCGLVVGFLVLSTWAWNIICAPDVFAWYLAFTSLNIGQLLYILYTMRPIR